MAKLVDAIHVLCSSSISSEQIKCANRMLLSFVDEFEILYGEANMVYNVHQLRHLADCVELNGPLFAYSNYCMEDNIGHIVSLVKGKTDVVSQLWSKYLLEKNLMIHLGKSERANEYYNSIESRLSFAVAKRRSGCLVIGKPITNSNLDETDMSFVRNSLELTQDDEIFEYKSTLLNTKIFYETIENSMKKRTNDSFIYNTETNKFSEIETIFVAKEQLYFFVNEKFRIENTECKYVKFLARTEQPEKKIIKPESIGQKHAFINLGSIISCSPFPNLYEKN